MRFAHDDVTKFVHLWIEFECAPPRNCTRVVGSLPLNGADTDDLIAISLHNLGGQLKTGNLSTGQNRQFSGGRDQGVLLRSFFRAQIGLHFGPPAPRAAFAHVRVMQQAIE